jgi:hypothetical protein
MENNKKAFVFDFDDTLATTDCKVKVISSKKQYVLTPAEFNEWKLAKDEVYDFSDFEKLINPVGLETLKLAKQVNDENHAVYILTARSGMSRNPIRVWLATHGISAKEIHCVGGKDANIAKEKRTVLMTIIENYDKTFFYDDCKENIETVQDLAIKAYLVSN